MHTFAASLATGQPDKLPGLAGPAPYKVVDVLRKSPTITPTMNFAMIQLRSKAQL